MIRVDFTGAEAENNSLSMPKKKAVLIITPYFAPQSHAAVFRAYKLAKYLPSRGWDVHVLTTDRNYLFLEDESLLPALPSTVMVHRAKYIEPTLRGVRMAFGGQDRTTWSLRNSPKDESLAPIPRSDPSARVYRYLLDRWLQVPDSFWTWKGPAIKMAGQLIREKGIPLIFTTSMPFTTLEIGNALRQKFSVKWVADIRDPLTYEHRMFSKHGKIFLKQREIEKTAISAADAMTFTSSAYPVILSDMYGIAENSRFHFIPTGLDEGFIPKGAARYSASTQSPFILFVGEYLGAYGGEFFEIFKRAITDPRLKGVGLKLKIVGRTDVNRRTVSPHIERLGLGGSVDFLEHMPQEKLYALIRESSAAVLCSAMNYGWWVFFAKLVDYLALQKPVLARVPDPSESRKWLCQSGLGIFLDGNIDEAAEKMVAFLIRSNQQTMEVNTAVCRKFLASEQVSRFSDLFNDLVSAQ